MKLIENEEYSIIDLIEEEPENLTCSIRILDNE